MHFMQHEKYYAIAIKVLAKDRSALYYAQHVDAGWSSLVGFRAPNPKEPKGVLTFGMRTLRV